MPFGKRWRIEGFLTTKTQLHIGSGATAPPHSELEGIEITAVVTDINERAYIPGASIKGNMRAWLKNKGCTPSVIEQIFGSEDVDKADSVGGKAEFWNAYALEEQAISNNSRYWRPERLTDVTVFVSIDRHRRTAVQQKLFHQEFVPPGVTFGMNITVQDAEEDEIVHLLYALEHGFSDDDPIVIGASTCDGWGRLEWRLKGISKMDGEGAKTWVEGGAPGTGYDVLSPLMEEQRRALMGKVEEMTFPTSDALLKLRLKLKFKGPFLVNDPGRVVKKETADHMPRRNHQGKIVLPAESFRGAFRSQAERIIRTLGGKACDPADDPCKAIQDIEEVEDLCLACQVFGASGWKSLVSFTDFVQCDEEKPPLKLRQEFVAIDRFTGGGADKLKFNAEAVLDPVLEGTIAVDTLKIKQWGLGLLALTFRDLIEGDITFGFGAAKGYGACEAEITDILIPDREEFLNACIKQFRKVVAKKEEMSHA